MFTNVSQKSGLSRLITNVFKAILLIILFHLFVVFPNQFIVYLVKIVFHKKGGIFTLLPNIIYQAAGGFLQGNYVLQKGYTKKHPEWDYNHIPAGLAEYNLILYLIAEFCLFRSVLIISSMLISRIVELVLLFFISPIIGLSIVLNGRQFIVWKNHVFSRFCSWKITTIRWNRNNTHDKSNYLLIRGKW